MTTEPQISVQPIETVQIANIDVLSSDYLQIDNFLTLDEHQQLLNYVLEKEADFVSTSTSTNAMNYRQSLVLYSFPNFSELILKRIEAIVPDVITKLGLLSFPLTYIESQLTAHNDGNYYKIHNDNGSPETVLRELTYVYYFYREPKHFFGGELLIYNSKISHNFYVNADSFKTVEPRNNSIVFFLSRYMHEVLPVICPSKAFADSRFTLNGWINRAANSKEIA
ncbi:MAG: 2OG-Fe(II) oxygenase [Aulosira sp. ZfuVER01]|nr:2OG-Fe(II) oxygenase [Aulosira sp. ZfuVER01]MDZ7998571.1 2OG-Fe(II) oxygenase [Aulosira sp. DedVER01a]MDZ8052085.1 2OG-Fe(II) oxygenase [Aulosira sp. ZfuCHP01]